MKATNKTPPYNKPTLKTDIPPALFLKEMLNMDYNECCDFLKAKYGSINRNYFPNENCKTPNQEIKRTNEGLFIHHIDEDKAIMLCEPKYAIKNPYEYQLADRLIYCDLLEHLILHIKIMENPHPDKNRFEVVGIGGVFNFIIPELNDLYSNFDYKQPYRIKVANRVKPLYDDYLMIIEYLIRNYPTIPLDMYLRSLSCELSRDPKRWNIKNNKKVFKDISNIYSYYYPKKPKKNKVKCSF